MHVSEIGMSSALDEEIVAHARNDQRAIVTLDADFHAIIVTTGSTAPSVIKLRAQGMQALEMAHLIKAVIDMSRADLVRGAIITADPTRIKLRRLPVGK